MITAEKVVFSPEELAKMKIRNFVNEGLKDIQEGNLYDLDEVFDEIESRLRNSGRRGHAFESCHSDFVKSGVVEVK